MTKTNELCFPFAAKLVRRSFPDKPYWELINDSVPLGTTYIVYGCERNVTIVDILTGERRIIDCYFVEREDTARGFLPAVCLQPIES